MEADDPGPASTTTTGKNDGMSKYITIIYDTELRRPGCVLLQATGGGDKDALNRYFTSEDWLLAPTANMRTMHGTEEQWERESGFVAERRKKGRKK